MKIVTCETKPFTAMRITKKTKTKHVEDFTDKYVESKNPPDAIHQPRFNVYIDDEVNYFYIDDWIVKDCNDKLQRYTSFEFKQRFNIKKANP